MQNRAFWAVLVAAAVFAGGLVLASVASLRGELAISMLVLGIVAAVVFPWVLIQVPRVATWRTSQGLCETFRDQLASADVIVTSEPDDYSLPLFLKRRVTVVGRAGELGVGLWIDSHPGEPIPQGLDPDHLGPDDIATSHLLAVRDLKELWESDRVVCLFAEKEFLPKFRVYYKKEELWEELGSNGETTLVINRPPSPGLSPARRYEERASPAR
ncbi:hypothetical protein AMJ85_04290 [candidate division BRC1 bacterium SM23_51]|nr:MAG: hypothetical protein AMJ85_04290 [candidate division BRC1 bacterium SM23_51]